MRKVAEQHIKTCGHCQRFKMAPGKSIGFLNPIPVVDKPFQVISMDHIGPLLKTDRCNKFILVAVDFLTWWVEAMALPDASTSWVVKFLESYIHRHGAPAKKITDRGGAFTSKEFVEALTRHKIDHDMISAGHPQANGLCERANKTLPVILAACASKKHDVWDIALERVVDCINRAYQETTKLTPFELVYGRKQSVFISKNRFFSNGNLRESKEVGNLRQQPVERTIEQHN